MTRAFAAAAVAAAIAVWAAVSIAAPADMAPVPAGRQEAFMVAAGQARSTAADADGASSIEVPAFLIDRLPVTRRQYAEFVRLRPEWRRSRVPVVLADAHYLEDWLSDLDAGKRLPLDAPVTRVSWFAATAYCRSKGRVLPTVDQWEWAAAGGGKDVAATRDRILQWYSRPASEPLGAVGQGAPNAYGVHDMHGLIWEWTLDFDSSLVSTDSRDPAAKDDPLFCGSGSLGAADPGDYATFMRYAFRNSLKAAYTTNTLGFRCAMEMGTR